MYMYTCVFMYLYEFMFMLTGKCPYAQTHIYLLYKGAVLTAMRTSPHILFTLLYY